MAGNNVFVAAHRVQLPVEVEVGRVEGDQAGLLGRQAQPDVVESKALGVVAGVVEVHQGSAGQHVGTWN